MKKVDLDNFIENIDITRMPIREIIATAYELGRCHEKAGIHNDERKLADDFDENLREASHKKAIKAYNELFGEGDSNG